VSHQDNKDALKGHIMWAVSNRVMVRDCNEPWFPEWQDQMRMGTVPATKLSVLFDHMYIGKIR
jgi:hypothetical protein